MKFTDKEKMIVVLITYIMSILVISNLSYEQGHFDGMKDICKDSTPAILTSYWGEESYACTSDNDTQPTPLYYSNIKFRGLQ
jgi:hypothetical protein